MTLSEVQSQDTKIDENKLSEILQGFGADLQRKFDDYVSRKNHIEEIWLEDERQHQGKLTSEEDSRLTTAKKSKIVVNATRSKCDIAEAILINFVHPTDDRSFGIQHTPIPDMGVEGIQLVPGEEAQQGVEQSGETRDDVAKKRAENMEREIDDQLTETKYHAECRDMIHDSVRLGTGIIKGPIVVNKTRRRWDTDGQGVSQLQIVEDLTPGAKKVSPWDFFPDPNAAKIEDAEDVFERKYLNRKQMQELAKRQHYLKDQIATLLDNEPATVSPNKLNVLREISGKGDIDTAKLYEVVEYTGPIKHEELVAARMSVHMMLGMTDDKESDDYIESPEYDPLEETSGVIVFCGSTVIKVSLNPAETGILPYSVFNWEEDPTSIFGFGIPYRLRNSQQVVNATWRMTMDNAGVTTGPQIVADQTAIEPANGSWEITNKKIWWLTEEGRKKGGTVKDAFGIFHIPGHHQELLAIFGIAMDLMDVETNLPAIMQGDQNAEVTKTKGGLELLIRRANIAIRRIVRSYDDNITDPFITRFYDYNMQNSQNPEIKGDFNTVAKGMDYLEESAASDEAVQEMLSFIDHPILGPMTDPDELYKRVCRARKVDCQGLLIPKDVREQNQENQGPSQAEIELIIKEAELKLKSREIDIKEAEARAKIQAMYAEVAIKEKITVDQLIAKVGYERDKLYLENRKVDVAEKKTQNDRDIAGVNAMNHQNELGFKAKSGRDGI